MKKRIGVFVCSCGSDISSAVEIDAVTAASRRMPGVVYAGDYIYWCSKSGQQMIIDTIKGERLDRMVVASCSPRLHEGTFMKTAASAGMNPYLVEIANIREHCSWVHKDKKEATVKAIALIRAAAAKVARNQELIPFEIPVVPRALVIGGGIAGIQSALDIAEAGYQVDLLERSPSIGGRMAQLETIFPEMDCPARILTPKMLEISSHPDITLYTYTEIEKVTGNVGNFDVTLRLKARSVLIEKCTGCGLCWEKCPVNVESEFDEGLCSRKAIYIPFPQAVPNVSVIDRASCRWFRQGDCAACKKACPPGAVDFNQRDEFLEKNYGVIITATGFDLFKPDTLSQFGCAKHPDMITGLEFERLVNTSGPTAGRLIRPSNGQVPRKVVFIHCVGYHDEKERKSFCSRICCMSSAKHALLFKERYPQTEAYLFYENLCSSGKGFEKFHRRVVEDYGAQYVRGAVSKIKPEGGKLLVHGVDSLNGQELKIEADMVVLAAALIPRSDSLELARLLGIGTDGNGFFSEAHTLLRPVETHKAGIFLAGACQGPKDIAEAVTQASAAASKAIGLLSYDILVSDPCVSQVNSSHCSGCLSCLHVCPYGAISEKIIEERVRGIVFRRLVAEVNEILCRGCGSCTVSCRPGAISLKGWTDEQLIAEVDAICL
ncbi:MAG: CoB--CoM heterodisulfide reductase iron-sulfur subunit A family protein [Bacillota bacterium]|nr:CoB--CoM heterodisulfide reductase iron-sulfur subunit A family protein [Bacillota bacterium]